MFFTFPAATESSQMGLGNLVWAEPGREHTTGARPDRAVPPGARPLLLHQARARCRLDEGTRCHEPSADELLWARLHPGLSVPLVPVWS